MAQIVGETDTPAVAELVTQNARLVKAIARQYWRRGLERRDLEQEGMLGLLHAAARYDASRRVRFSTYARHWVRLRVRTYAENNRRIVPPSQARNLRKVRRLLDKAIRRIEQHNGDRARSGELAAALGVTTEDVRIVLSERGSPDVSLGAYEPPAPEASPEEIALARELQDKARRLLEIVMEGLDERGREILEERLLSVEPTSLRKLGRRWSISAERVRQLEARVLDELRERWHRGEPEEELERRGDLDAPASASTGEDR